jgi:hypothetical protein
MSKEFCNYLYEKCGRLKDTFTSLKGHNYSFAKLVVLCVLFVGIIGFVYGISKYVLDYFRYIFWTTFSFTLIFVFVRYYWANFRRKELNTITFKPTSVLLWFFPVLIFLNGICPYLGLKTESSYAMFSNLRTEGGISNHFLVPAEAQIFSFQNDLVEVTSSSSKTFQKLADRKQVIPYFQFKEDIAHFKPGRVEYIRGGKRHIFDKKTGSTDKELAEATPFVLKKFLRFRPLEKNGEQFCKH